MHIYCLPQIEYNFFGRGILMKLSMFLYDNSHQVQTYEDAKRVVGSFIDEGDNIDALDHGGFNALHRVCATGNINMVQALIDAGADINKLNNTHQTPIDLSESNKHDNITQLLLKYNAKHAIEINVNKRKNSNSDMNVQMVNNDQSNKKPKNMPSPFAKHSSENIKSYQSSFDS